jgi:hypothetical protein
MNADQKGMNADELDRAPMAREDFLSAFNVSFFSVNPLWLCASVVQG